MSNNYIQDKLLRYSPNMELMDPAINTCSEPLYMPTSMIPLRMVSLTLAPRSTEPTVSNTVARMHACRRVTTPEPTAVPNELATSLAPTEKAKTKAMMKPTISSHVYSVRAVCAAIPTVLASNIVAAVVETMIVDYRVIASQS